MEAPNPALAPWTDFDVIIGRAVIVLLMVAIRNAWDSVTYLVTGSHVQEDRS